MVICLERGADLHMAQLMPLPLTASCFTKIQIGFTFLVLAHPGSPGKRAVKCVCVCVLSRSLRSSITNLLARPSGITGNFSSPAFSVSAPSIWNCLPIHIHSIDNNNVILQMMFIILQSPLLLSGQPAPVPEIRLQFLVLINLCSTYVWMLNHVPLCKLDRCISQQPVDIISPEQHRSWCCLQ